MTSSTPTSRNGPNRVPARSGLDVRDLRVVLANGADVVDEVSFAIRPGELLGLVGESGSGKTTVGMALLGHVRKGATITGGSVLVDGLDLLRLTERELRRARGAAISYVPQDPASALNPAMRIGAQLCETLDVHDRRGRGDHAARVAAILDSVALPHDRPFLRRFPHQLSGGQQQRVALAIAFALRPSVIVCDEPTTGLDVTTQARVLRTIKELCSAHDAAALYVSHDIAVVSELADHVAVMYAGRVVEIGPAGRIFDDCRHPYTQVLLAAVPEVAARRALVGIPGHAPLPGGRSAGCAFLARCAHAVDACSTAAPPPRPIEPGWTRRCFVDVAAMPSARRSAVPLPEPAAGPALLEVTGLRARHGALEVVHDVDVKIGHDECVCVVGESGSGKTTLARCLGGLHATWTGEAVYEGRPLSRTARDRPHDTRRAIQYIFQNPYSSLNPRRTVGQILGRQLELFDHVDGLRRHERVAASLEQVALSPQTASRYPEELSGGERQRVAIARALVVRPRVLLCDEITSALDVSVQAAIVGLLASLRAELGLSLLFITHNLAMVRSIADNIVVMTAGSIVERGAAEDVFTNPATEYTRTLLSSTPSLHRPAPVDDQRAARDVGRVV